MRRGLNCPEIIVCCCVFVLAGTLLLPAVQQETEFARREKCNTNIRGVGLALMNYEEVFKRFPTLDIGWGGPAQWERTEAFQGTRWSGGIALLPFLTQKDLYTRIHAGFESGGKTFGPYGTVAGAAGPLDPSSLEYPPNLTPVDILRCPSDPTPAGGTSLARLNYAFCMADGQNGQTTYAPEVNVVRNCFQRGMPYGIESITDGYAMTVAFGEIATPRGGLPPGEGPAEISDAAAAGLVAQDLPALEDYRGIDPTACGRLRAGDRYSGKHRLWATRGVRRHDVLPVYTGFTTILPPNAASCTPTQDNPYGESFGIYSSGSYHPGGAHVAFFDGRTRFISDGISIVSAGNAPSAEQYYSPGRTRDEGRWVTTPNWHAPSPFGVWGALGTARSGESVPTGEVESATVPPNTQEETRTDTVAPPNRVDGGRRPLEPAAMREMQRFAMRQIAAIFFDFDAAALRTSLSPQAAWKNRGPGSASAIVKEVERLAQDPKAQITVRRIVFSDAATLAATAKLYPKLNFLQGERIPVQLGDGLACLVEISGGGPREEWMAFVVRRVEDQLRITYLDDTP